MQGEVAALARRYGRPRNLVHILPVVEFGPLNRGRDAEVAMAIRRPNGRFLLQTKENYPTDTFRLPTGGIKRGEAIEHALLRETEEETSLTVDVSRFIAVMTYRTVRGNRVFSSYLFLLEERSGTLLTIDQNEGISGWLEADRERLDLAAQRLHACPAPWDSWGHFRALAIEALVAAIGSAPGSAGPGQATKVSPTG
jgi:ADP-ribose pyrophosphatase YjhB (NUDIX family)